MLAGLGDIGSSCQVTPASLGGRGYFGVFSLRGARPLDTLVHRLVIRKFGAPKNSWDPVIPTPTTAARQTNPPPGKAVRHHTENQPLNSQGTDPKKLPKEDMPPQANGEHGPVGDGHR